MLVLSRKPGESIILGVDNEISITILKVRGDSVQLGFVAPSTVPVYRYELRARMGQPGTSPPLETSKRPTPSR